MTTYLAPPSPTPSAPRGAIAGFLAAAAALGTGELLAGLFGFLESPFLIVAEKFIDLTPKPLKDFAVDTFGENDKIALIGGALLFVAVFGVVMGIVSRRRPIVGYIGVSLIGVAALASGVTTPSTGFVASLAVVVAVPVGLALLYLLLNAPTETVGDMSEGESRRSFLALSGMALAGAAVAGFGGRLLGRRFSAVASRMGITLADPIAAAPAIPASASFEGAVPFITPFEDFYRVDTAIAVPQVRAEEFNLRIFGMVDNEINLSYDDLMAMELEEHTITLTCVSNTVGGDLMSTATWRGVRLDTLLEMAGVQSGADQIVGRSVDDYTAGFPVDVATDGRHAMVVLGMNGEVLPIDRGFPARLIVPGLTGYVSATKWLKELEVTTFADFEQYWVVRGWDAEAEILTQSRIDTPQGAFEGAIEGGRVVIAGVAWDQTIGIEKVELRIDGGDWVEAELADEVNVDTWRQWRYDWDVTESGLHSITVRATNKNGELQTEDRTEPFPNVATGWQTQRVQVA